MVHRVKYWSKWKTCSVIEIRFTSIANRNFVELRGLTVRLVFGKDISNGYVTSLFWITQCGMVVRAGNAWKLHIIFFVK
jgi:hypothetical protein